jgi:carbon-monoxide dehydrogenase large subunit
VEVTNVQVITGDTREFQWGTGTFASRGAVVAGSACHAAAVAVRDKALTLAARLLEVDPGKLDLDGGRVFVRGSADRGFTLGELATKANPLRGAVTPGTKPVHDCGTIINPMLVDGQIHGGVAHGIGNAFYEQLVYDEQGQLLNASFMDYLLPTATDVPTIETAHRETPSPHNVMGLKGVGEAGCIPTGAVFAQAVEDALGDPRFEIREIPLSPNRLFNLISEARRA